MSIDAPTREWSKVDIDAMLEVLDVLEEPGLVFSVWHRGPVEVIDGVRHMQMPCPVYHDVIDRFWELCYQSSAYIDPYNTLPEDRTRKKIPFSVLGAHFPIEYFETATLDQVRRYLVLCTRGERFCDGHIDGQFESGSLLAALRRVRSLRAEMGD